MTKAHQAFVKRRIRRGAAELKEQFERFVKATTFAYGFNVEPCTRQAPHICKVNGPCNGTPNDPELPMGESLTPFLNPVAFDYGYNKAKETMGHLGRHEPFHYRT